MMCCSPDFTIPDPELRKQQVDHEIHSIRMSAELGAKLCRVLSGQRRKDITREEGMGYVVDSINACLPVAKDLGVILIIENHYKDDFWTEPEFAQMMDVFVDLVSRIDSPYFGVNFDPSNAIAAGEEPLELLEKVIARGEKVKITMKGFCSPLASTDYNVNLAKRRVCSLQNYFKEYKKEQEYDLSLSYRLFILINHDTFLNKLFTCPYCLGMWLSVGFSWSFSCLCEP